MDMRTHLRAASVLAHLLDNRFQIGKVRFGAGVMIGLIPVVGDIIDAILALYLVWIAVRIRIPSTKIAQMLGNILINFVIGQIPVIGDATYVLRKANIKNLKILQRYNPHSIEGQVVQ